MKNLFRSIAKKTFGFLSVAVAMTALNSCDNVIYDYEGDCDPHYFVKFEYTMHMERGDAFKEQVRAVDLWIFNSDNGKYIDHYYSTVEDLAQTNYLMPIDVAPGNYDFVAWCGDIDNRHFKVNDFIESKADATCRLEKRIYEDQGATSSDNLDLIFHGKLDHAVLPDTEGNHIYTIPLIRDVNNISVTLQHISGAFDTEHKNFTLVDKNGFLFHDNSIDETDEDIIYKPWSIRTGLLENSASDNNTKADDDSFNSDGSYGNFMNVEFSTSRLTDSHNPLITISDSQTGKIVFQIPLMQWIKELKSQKYSVMENQEYLDRNHEYELMVFLQDDGRGGWTAVSVVINGYHVIDNGEQDL